MNGRDQGQTGVISSHTLPNQFPAPNPHDSFNSHNSHSSQGVAMESALSEAIEHFNATANLLAVVGLTDLPRAAATNGGEWCGPCPLCGGSDRLRAWPNHPAGVPRAWCRRCGCSGDVLTWAMRVSGLDPGERGATRRFLEDWRNAGTQQPSRMPYNRNSRPGATPDTPVGENQDEVESALNALRELAMANGRPLTELVEAWAERVSVREQDDGQLRADAEAGALADVQREFDAKAGFTPGDSSILARQHAGASTVGLYHWSKVTPPRVDTS